MSEASLRALLIEDNPSDADLLVEMLAGEEQCIRVVRAECMAQAESLLKDASGVDAILLDLGLPDSDGLDSLARAGSAAPHVPIVVLTGLDDEELGVEAVRKGAQDYLVKGQTTPRFLARVIRHAVERNRLIEAKNQFLANISHELRTPMNAILGMIDLALRNELKPSVKDYLTTARESAGLLLGLLNNLLDSAKIESGSFELEISPLDIRQILDQTASELGVRAAEKGLAFSCQAPEDLPSAVLGDKLRLRQVLLNLGGNAIKFTERGEVTMSVRVESVGPDEVGLEFAVRDTGIGIPRGDLDRIFKPFAQGDSSTARRYGGTGLGLSISADLVAMMGGRLWAESEPGEGSAFYFTAYLPLARQLQSLRDASAQIRPALPASMRILLVEDNPASQKLVAYIFQEAGHSIDIAEDGQQALQKLEKTCYDAVLMDVQMPVMDGLAATAAIRAREEAGGAPGTPGRVPIIAMTARAMKGDRERCLVAGMDGYVSKPIDAAQLFDELARLMTDSTTQHGGFTADPSNGCPAEHPLADRGEGADGASAGVFDLPMALERCCQSWEVFADMVACLCADNELLFPRMYAALDRGDFEELGQLAHRMRGTLSCLAGKKVLDAATTVEHGADGCRTKAREAIVKLEGFVAALIAQCRHAK